MQCIKESERAKSSDTYLDNGEGPEHAPRGQSPEKAFESLDEIRYNGLWQPYPPADPDKLFVLV